MAGDEGGGSRPPNANPGPPGGGPGGLLGQLLRESAAGRGPGGLRCVPAPPPSSLSSI